MEARIIKMHQPPAKSADQPVSLLDVVEELFPLQGSSALFVSLLTHVRCDQLSAGVPASSPFLAALNDFMLPTPAPPKPSGRQRRIRKTGDSVPLGGADEANRSTDRRSKMRELYRAFKRSEPADVDGESRESFLAHFNVLKSKPVCSPGWLKLLSDFPACARRLGKHLLADVLAATDLTALYEEFTHVTTRFLCVLTANRTRPQVKALRKDQMLKRLNRNPHKFRGYGYLFTSARRRLQGFVPMAVEIGRPEVARVLQKHLKSLDRLRPGLVAAADIGQFLDAGRQVFAVLQRLHRHIGAFKPDSLHEPN